MIDTIEQVTCKACGSPLTQLPGKGHRKREYCNAACRQRAHRTKEQPSASSVTNVTIDEKQRIVQLEQENAMLRALRSTRTSKASRIGYIKRAMGWGEKLGYQSLTIPLYVGEGLPAWEAFMREANEKLLIRLIIAAERAAESKQS